MNLAIYDPTQEMPGLKILFPEAYYCTDEKNVANYSNIFLVHPLNVKDYKFQKVCAFAKTENIFDNQIDIIFLDNMKKNVNYSVKIRPFPFLSSMSCYLQNKQYKQYKQNDRIPKIAPDKESLYTHKYAVDSNCFGKNEIFLGGALRLNTDDQIWPFSEQFSESTIYSSIEEQYTYFEKHPQAFITALNRQRYIFEKYYSKKWLRSYILEESGMIPKQTLSNYKIFQNKHPGNGIRPSLGNNIFCYFALKIMQKELNYQIVPNKENLHEPIHIGDQHWSSLDLISLPSRDIFMDGYFQYSEPLMRNRAFLKSLISEDNPDAIMPFSESQFILISDIAKFKGDEPQENDLILHIRLGDFKHDGMSEIIHPRVYFNIIANLKFDRLIIVTDSIKEDFEKKYINAFQQRFSKVIIRSGSILEDFKYLVNAKKIIVSNSTFCWIATFLGNAEDIHIIQNNFHRDQHLGKIGDHAKLYPVEYISMNEIMKL